MFKNLFTYKGRIRRDEYGYSILIGIVITMILTIILFGSFLVKISDFKSLSKAFLFLLVRIFIGIILTLQAIKRMHDVGKSGWWTLVPFYSVWLLFSRGKAGPNVYGEDPRENNIPISE